MERLAELFCLVCKLFFLVWLALTRAREGRLALGLGDELTRERFLFARTLERRDLLKPRPAHTP